MWLLNEDSDIQNIDSEDDSHFPYYVENLSDENLGEDNHSSGSKMKAFDNEMRKMINEKNDKITKWKKEVLKTKKKIL